MVDTGPWLPPRGEPLQQRSHRTPQHQPAGDRPRSPLPVPDMQQDMFFDNDDEALAYGFEDHEPSLSSIMMADSHGSSDLDLGMPDTRRGSIPLRPPVQQSPRLPEARQKQRPPAVSRDPKEELYRPGKSEATARDKSSRGASEARIPKRKSAPPPRPAYTMNHSDDEFCGDEDDDGAGIVDIDSARLPRNPDESQQDLAERINQLTRTINANAQLCLETSRKMVALAQENKHLAYEAGAQLDTYVLQPALKLGQALRTYCPGVDEGVQALWEYEAQIRKRVINGLNGRDALFQTGAVGGRQGKEVDRLKNRLIEQDALLRDSSQHIRKLMNERDRLRRKLENGYQNGDSGAGGEGPARPSYRDLDDVVKQAQAGPAGRAQHQRTPSHAEDAQLAEQLGELRMLVDRLPVLNDVPSSNDTQAGHSASTHLKADQDDEEDWTLL
ncbi:uncharacterized protein B0I36DRAFT_311539 [Microdochium trichocladiopsis]|uniref:Uncharacterized protein n=1 Tax=Microdochium trichocladiopsis TaxID=1682393 RepID=A0A9P9BWH9_9PEZI|nr:uncharacterized protein B0I36DRAFT_311539 [Microdochium trichocladiopsis]KAH7040812.1 hypothetical protein B0I36DRAFT_311539 [Microdochium trichocladiopsis]